MPCKFKYNFVSTNILKKYELYNPKMHINICKSDRLNDLPLCTVSIYCLVLQHLDYITICKLKIQKIFVVESNQNSLVVTIISSRDAFPVVFLLSSCALRGFQLVSPTKNNYGYFLKKLQIFLFSMYFLLLLYYKNSQNFDAIHSIHFDI